MLLWATATNTLKYNLILTTHCVKDIKIYYVISFDKWGKLKIRQVK